MVLSKFCTLTLLRLISFTVPSAPYLGISIQSPTRIESLAETCILATKPKIVSLKTSIRIAEAAPSDNRNDHGELPVKIEKQMVPPIKSMMIWQTCK
ncbi:hypothetical protein D3C80_1426580 [compost metagenome]